MPPDAPPSSRYHWRVETSAGISSELGAAIAQHERRAARRHAAMLAVLLALAVALLGAVVSVALMSAEAGALARCNEERDRAGVGRAAALRAMDAPEAQRRFLYRVANDDDGYLVRLVVQTGPFLGDSWERDAYGRTRHAHDVCSERFTDELGSRLLARLED